MRVSFIVAALAAAALIIVVVKFWPEISGQDAANLSEEAPNVLVVPASMTLSEGIPEVSLPRPVPNQVVEEAAEAEVLAPRVAVPALAESDTFVIDHLQNWPIPLAWLARQDLVAKATGVLVNSADGRVASRQVAFMVPADNYSVQQVGEQFFVDPASFERYNRYVDILENIPPSALVKLLGVIEPLMQEALTQLGERRSPREIVGDTVARIKRLPQLPAQVELLRPAVVYTYADPALEARSEFDKQLLRFGPKNISRIDQYLIEFIKYY